MLKKFNIDTAKKKSLKQTVISAFYKASTHEKGYNTKYVKKDFMILLKIVDPHCDLASLGNFSKTSSIHRMPREVASLHRCQ